MIFAFLLLLLIGAWVYSGISVWAALRYLAVSAEAAPANEPISVLKPLAGLDEGLEQNLRSFFDQSYSAFELIFAVRDAADPCVPYVRQLCAEYPRIPSRLILTGEPPYPHAKVYSLACMLQASAHDLLVMSDSDIRVEADFLSRIAGEFASGEIALATCPYRAVAGASAWPGGFWSGTFWSSLEALGMNTTFWQGVLTARLLDGMKFAIGPTIVARKKAIDAIGGIESVRNYLAEDFELGRAVARSGARVILSAHRVEHRIGSEGLARNFAHRLRWARTSRRSRPAGTSDKCSPIRFHLRCCCARCLRPGGPSWWLPC